jgi:hypothetical protein
LSRPASGAVPLDEIFRYMMTGVWPKSGNAWRGRRSERPPPWCLSFIYSKPSPRVCLRHKESTYDNPFGHSSLFLQAPVAVLSPKATGIEKITDDTLSMLIWADLLCLKV